MLRVRRGRRFEQVRGDRGGVGSLFERPQSGQALVENAPERIDVRPGVDRLPLELLGRCVVDRPDEGPGLREPALRADLLGGSPKSPRYACSYSSPEATRTFCGLDVAMHETVGMDGVERLRDLREDVEGTPRPGADPSGPSSARRSVPSM